MCGITGILRTDGQLVSEQQVRSMNDVLTHRGPDGGDVYTDGKIGLGHRRLAILDLEGGKQPLCNEDGSIWVTFNGEIYNFRELRNKLVTKGHQFKTKSDTEVIVHAYEEWGIGCLDHLRGMFAFAIWDSRRQQLFLARDRVGIKPLLYSMSAGRTAFASELQAFKVLDGFRPTLDIEAVDLYLHFQYIPAPYTIYREIRKLPPAHYIVIGADGRTEGPQRYWDVKFQPDYSLTEDEWIERLDAGLRESIGLHLVSDVPFGAFLSGGVDSSMVVAYMSDILKEPPQTFTIGSEHAEYDERSYARQVAQKFGTQHHEQIIRPDALEVLPTLVAHYGEPFADSSAVAMYYASKAAAQRVKMVLSGDGGDEIFAGYNYFPSMLHQHPEPRGSWRKFRRSMGNLGRYTGLVEPLPSPQATWYGRTPYFSHEQRRQLWHSEHLSVLAHTRQWNDEQFEPVRHSDLLSQCQYVDTHNYLPYDNLAKVDIASMCHGLEVRVPLLDHVLLESIVKLPLNMKLRGMDGYAFDPVQTPLEMVNGKYILKKLGERYFSQQFLQRRKMGFSVPVPEWLAGPLGPQLKERLYDGASGMGELFEPSYINQLVNEHQKGTNHGFRLWSLLFLAEWQHQNRVPLAS